MKRILIYSKWCNIYGQRDIRNTKRAEILEEYAKTLGDIEIVGGIFRFYRKYP